jgi:hypothetical protein
MHVNIFRGIADKKCRDDGLSAIYVQIRRGTGIAS